MIDFPSRSRHEWVEEDKLVIEAEEGDIVQWFKEVWESHREEINEEYIQSVSFEVITTTEDSKSEINDSGGDSKEDEGNRQEKSKSKSTDGGGSSAVIEGPLSPKKKDGKWVCPLPDCDFSDANKVSVTGHMSVHQSEGVYKGRRPKGRRNGRANNSRTSKSGAHLSEEDRTFKPISESTQKAEVVKLIAEVAPNRKSAVTVDQLTSEADSDKVSLSSLGSMVTKLYKWEWLDSNREESPPYKYWLSEKGEVHLRDLK